MALCFVGKILKKFGIWILSDLPLLLLPLVKRKQTQHNLGDSEARSGQGHEHLRELCGNADSD